MLTPVGTAMLFRVFPPAERARASTILIVPTVVAPALGPIVGGLLIDHASWRWIFYVNAPIGVLGFLFGFLFLKESKEPTAGRFDLAGFSLSATGLAGILYALSQGPEKGWGSFSVVMTGVGGIVLLTALGWVETHIEHPMLALRLYREKMFRTSNFINSLAYGSFASFLFLFPQMVQQMLGKSALSSGLTSLPQAVGMIAMSQIVGKLYHTVGPRRLVIFGLSMVTLSNIPFSFISLDTSLWTIRLLMLLRGMSMAFSFVPLQAATYANISKSDTGRASAIFCSASNVCSTRRSGLVNHFYFQVQSSLCPRGATRFRDAGWLPTGICCHRAHLRRRCDFRGPYFARRGRSSNNARKNITLCIS